MACKNTWKNAVLLEKKKCDIFPPLGVPLLALDLQNAAFATKGKLKKQFKKMKWHIKIHAKMPFYQKEREVLFSPSWGTPMRSRLAKCCFCNERKIEKEFKKMKWHVKIHAKMPFYQKEREVTFFLLWGYPYAL